MTCLRETAERQKMTRTSSWIVAGCWMVVATGQGAIASQAGERVAVTVRLETPMPPPSWALLERELLRANARACEEFFNRYFDDRGYLECVERWGGDDGPDDAIENVNDWPVLYALGASESILKYFKKAWEGHLRQYTAARTTQVPLRATACITRSFP